MGLSQQILDFIIEYAIVNGEHSTNFGSEIIYLTERPEWLGLLLKAIVHRLKVTSYYGGADIVLTSSSMVDMEHEIHIIHDSKSFIFATRSLEYHNRKSTVGG